MTFSRSVIKITGNTGDKIEIKKSKKDEEYGIFSVAVHTSNSVTKEDETTWYTIMVFKKQILEYAKQIKKGEFVCVEGILGWSIWKKNEDNVYKYPRVYCDYLIIFVPYKPETTTEKDVAPRRDCAPFNPTLSNDKVLDDIPF